MRVTYPQWMGGYDNNRPMASNARQGKGKGKGNWNPHYQHQHQYYNNGYPSYHSHNQMMRMTMSTGSTMTSRVHRKVLRIPSKRHPGKALPGKLHSISRITPGKVAPGKRLRPTQTHCDNSNDSGLGFDQYGDASFVNGRQIAVARLAPSGSGESSVGRLNNVITSETDYNLPSTSSLPSSTITAKVGAPETATAAPASNNCSQAKRLKIENKFDVDDTCSNDAFYFRQQQQNDQHRLFQHQQHQQQQQMLQQQALQLQQQQQHQKAVAVNQKIDTSRNLAGAPLTALKISPAARPALRTSLRRGAVNATANAAAGNNVGVCGVVTLQTQIGGISQNGKCQLQILAQPEQQHRARYQTEGSRGAVKDRSGNGFPIVKLIGYDKPTTLQIFIGTDVGRVAPHMFYQACKVSGKNSTPCNEKKVEGTIIIEIDLKPENDMTATCDCVGILKERNVDVEHRFPDQTSGPRSKKKSTRCRMVFRAQLTHNEGTQETLQVTSQQIICTQPPGVPEICKKSLITCPATGGLELYIIGKNFLKDTRVIFQARRQSPLRGDTYDVLWEETVIPDKEFLQQTHLVCQVPSYINPEIIEPVTVQLYVTSSNKCSESHSFIYTPKGAFGSPTSLSALQSSHSKQDLCIIDDDSSSSSSIRAPAGSALMLWTHHLAEPKNEHDAGMMPPPTTTLPLNIRRTSLGNLLTTEQISPPILKAEIMDDSSQGSIISNGPEIMSHDSMDQFSVNEGSLDGSNSAHTPEQLQTMAIMNSSPLELILQKGSGMTATYSTPMETETVNSLIDMDTTTAMNVVNIRVKQEQEIAAQIQELVSNPATTNTELMSKINDLTNSRVEGVSSNVLYVNNLGTLNANAITPTNQTITLDQANVFGTHQSIMSEADTAAATLNEILSYPSPAQAISPTILSPSPPNLSPLSTDVMLNSQPAATLSSSPTLIPTTIAGTTALTPLVTNSESDIILNPTISPTMMCNTTGESNALMNSQVSVGDSSLLSVTLPSTTPQTTSETLLTNFMHQQSNTAVKNMILNAAADILSSEPNSINPETTMNALMSLNSAPLMTQDNQPQTTTHPVTTSNNSVMSMQNQQQTSPGSVQPHHNYESQATQSLTNMLSSNTNTSAVVVLTGSNQMIQNVVAAAANQNANDVIQSQVQTTNNMMNNYGGTSQILSNTAAANATQNFLNNLQSRVNMTTANDSGMTGKTRPQDSVLQAVALIRSDLPKSADGQNVLNTSIAANVTNIVTTPSTVQAATTAAPFSHDITTMSDNDLISYINPSCFDQI